MIVLKSAFVGMATVLLGCLLAPIAILMGIAWSSRKHPGGPVTIGFSPFSPIDAVRSHPVGFLLFLLILFAAGFLPSAFLFRR